MVYLKLLHNNFGSKKDNNQLLNIVKYYISPNILKKTFVFTQSFNTSLDFMDLLENWSWRFGFTLATLTK